MGHYYAQDASPRHFVEMTSRPGEMRPTRVTDARKHGWFPSVTTVMDVLAKHALVGWKIDQHLAQAYDVMISYAEREKVLGLSETVLPDYADFVRMVKDQTEREMDKAPTAGTDVHKVLEAFFLGEPVDPQHDALCEAVMDAITEHCGGYRTCAPEARFVDPLGFAGCIDLPLVADDKWIIDFKTKQTADKFKPGKMAYPDHSRQLAAYRQGYGWPEARCANLFICIETGEVDFHEHDEGDLQKGWETFKDCLNIWKRENYAPEFQKSAA